MWFSDHFIIHVGLNITSAQLIFAFEKASEQFYCSLFPGHYVMTEKSKTKE